MSTSPPSDDPLPGDPAPLPATPVMGPLPSPEANAHGQASPVGQDVFGSLHDNRLPPQFRRRVWLPLILFVCTCVTTFLAGCFHWQPEFLWNSPGYRLDRNGYVMRDARGRPVVATPLDAVRDNWRDGLTFMSCVIGVLLFHEMGHFLMTVRHRIPASYPYFIPMPIMLTGTMGAVISMDGSRANRKELFDIGLAGPLAGLVLTIPLVIIGIQTAKVVPEGPGTQFGDPLFVTLLLPLLRQIPEGHVLHVNAIYMAGWVGMLITGLNMMPVSQLDGGHVSYAVLGPLARWVGRGLLVATVLFIVWGRAWNWSLMLLIVILIGMDHPPTADDTVKIGPLRWTLGLVSLLIPIFCFTPVPLDIVR